MSLETWLQNGWLKKQPTSPDEITRLLQIVERDLRDCQAEGISSDARFSIAFNAALQAATAALRVCGYKAHGQGHHVRVIDSLELTIGADSKTVQTLQALERKRNICNYDVSGSVSDEDLKRMKAIAVDLRDQVTRWMKGRLQ